MESEDHMREVMWIIGVFTCLVGCSMWSTAWAIDPRGYGNEAKWWVPATAVGCVVAIFGWVLS